ncbi:cation transporting ATPase C-terminal domain-containing protein [Flagellimonas taeanensis]|uniref:cation transporting ATPase C-terminal domain-containing protein n=1 Tax=Flagellimonas taeanensis TaxID=1005926 RepID=UPI0009FB3922|nr:cation-translocating P-type ATPase C-terminal domain-containing protein [Allomuricauda taeanensis]
MPHQTNNLAFCTLIIVQLLNIFNMTKRQTSFLFNGVIKNPWVWGAIVLSITITVLAYSVPSISLVPLNWVELQWPILFGSGSLVLSHILKKMGFAQ